jgi:hypothetical protein
MILVWGHLTFDWPFLLGCVQLYLAL